MLLHDRISLRHFRRPRGVLTDALLLGEPVQEPVMKGPLKPAPAGWSRISSVLYYDDSETAIDWLCNAFGFMVRLKVAGEDAASSIATRIRRRPGHDRTDRPGGRRQGRLAARQASPLATERRNTQSLCLYVDDVDAHCERARRRAPESSASPVPPTMARTTGPTAAMARWIRKATCGGSCSACARPGSDRLRLRLDHPGSGAADLPLACGEDEADSPDR